MKLKLNCRDATRLVLQAEDRPLRTSEKLAVRFHLLICQACPEFSRQVRFMRQAMGRWKGYAERDEAPPPSPPGA